MLTYEVDVNERLAGSTKVYESMCFDCVSIAKK